MPRRLRAALPKVAAPGPPEAELGLRGVLCQREEGEGENMIEEAKMVIDEKEQREQERRQKYLGGSDVAAVLGLSPWRTPGDVYRAKKGLNPVIPMDPARERILRRGRLMEPVVVEMLIAEHGVKVTKRSSPERRNQHVDPDCEFLGAEIDFEWEVTPEMVAKFPAQIDPALIGTTQNGEVKTAHPFVAMRKFGEEGTDEIPIEYAAQAMHGLSVSGRQLTLFPVLVGSDNLILYWVKRAEDVIRDHRDRLIRFWLDNVLAGVPPFPLDLTDVYKLIPRDAARSIEATPEVLALVRSLRFLKDRAAATEEGIGALQFEIGCFLLGAKEMEEPKKGDRGKVVVTSRGEKILWVAYQEQNRIDAEMLRLKHPEAAAECATVSKFYTFNLKRRS